MTDEMELCDTVESNTEITTNEDVEDMKQKYIALSEAQSDIGEHLMKVTIQNIEYESTVETYKRKYKSLQQEISKEITTRERVERENRKLRCDIDEEKKSSIERKRKFDEMESNNKDLSKKLNDKNESCRCNCLRVENETLISSKRGLELQLTQYEALIVELKAKIDHDEKKYDIAIEDFKRIADLTNESCTTMQNEINSLKREKASLMCDCDMLRKENERLNAAKSTLISERDRLQAINMTLQGSLSSSPLSPTFANLVENSKKQIPAEVRLKSRHASMDVDKNSKTDHETEDYKILKSKYAELKDRYNRKIDDFKKKEETWNQERKTAHVNYESLEHSYKTKIEKIAAKIKQEKMKCYEDLNVVYRKDADILRTERDSARAERDSARKEVEDYASKVKKLSIMSSMNFAPWKQQMTSMKEEIRLLKVDYIMMKDECIRNLKSLTNKVGELINDRQSLENNFNTLVPFVYSVVSKSHSLSEKFRQLKTENDRLSVAIEMSMSTKTATEEKMDVSEDNIVVDNDASECDKLKQKIDFMAAEKAYFENEAISKQIRAEELEIQLVHEQNKRCRIEFELHESKQLLNAEKERSKIFEDRISYINRISNQP